ncbi:beta-ketoacyl-ACP synthase 3 [Chlorogloeopsis sp. ULAP01]|jgi:3-oxoacyl-[acyl-carrier-protein] synthase III|uniref:beta-ketoacyl-ACP synthase 3 n=1 Tax=Chlorogloeopsis sp. ULAP01 TaxID=3056483 RepID=UPI0025AAB771|nr:beta-ketoacyl-ACP synthase 3 [Chlorogloeopsis sp. ULAP01]MDM9383452.1 beta-ketoacyl-ACP synthase 3 [Chlorogloeopsis sp. ULAP01]
MKSQFMSGIRLTGTGSAVPSTYLDNHQLSKIVVTSDEWIASRTGIYRRHLLPHKDSLTNIATSAAQKAMMMAGLTPQQLDLIILATSTPDDLFGNASLIQAQLGARQAVAFDLTAACSGFVYSLITAAQFIRTGAYRNVLVIGADVLSRWVDWSDRSTCVLFGDGAGAVVLQANEQDYLLGFQLHTDGTQNHHLNLRYQGQARTLVDGVFIDQGKYQPLKMNGKEIYRFAIQKVPEVIEKALFQADITAAEVDWLLMHQANQRILEAVAARLDIPARKIISNVANYGNTSGASIPLALDEAIRCGQIQPHNTLAIAGFGAGLTWGAAIFKWV